MSLPDLPGFAWWILPLAAALVSYVLGFAVWRLLLKWQVMDKPNDRSSHAVPTPRGGGFSIMAVLLPGLMALAWLTGSKLVVMIGCAAGLLAVVSFMDDRMSLSWRLRIGVQLLAALAVAVALLAPYPSMPLWSGALLVLLFVGYANAFNFMDGINGLAAGQAVISGLGLAAMALIAGIPPTHPAVLLSLLIAGAAAGFLPHNFPQARMFMGDVGSVPLGFLLMVLTAWLAREGGWWLLLPLGALHANFIMDTTITMLRRAGRGDTLHQAHREHFYQRLNRAGWSHPAVTGLQLGLSAALLGLLLATLAFRPGWLPWALAGLGATWLAFFAFCERELRRRNGSGQ